MAWFKGLTSEVRRNIKTSRGEYSRWVKTAERNEPLDTTVYALFCSQALDHYKMTEAQWARLENDLLPDLFDAPSPAPAPANTAQAATEIIALAVGAIEVRDSTEPGESAQPVQAALPLPLPNPVTPARRKPTPQVVRAPQAPASSFASADWLARL